MAANAMTHPSAETLRLLAAGKLDDAAAASVLHHLEQCPACRQAAGIAQPDSFLDRLRAARDGTPAPTGELCSFTASPPTSAGAGVPGLPPELAGNPHYQVLRELGKGGMGVVYLARNVLMDRLEVLKVVNRTLLTRGGAVERFLQEIRSAARLNHDNVVKAYSALPLGELLVFAMEYIEGEDLSRLVRQQGPLPLAHACFYAIQVALGLQHAHENGLIHRDIKPANLILSRQGKKHVVKILDFGLAKASREGQTDGGLTAQGAIMGTPDFIAPEQTMDAGAADIRADIYSLGCTLYFLLSGRPPFQGETPISTILSHVQEQPRPLMELRPEVPAALWAVVAKMLAKEPAQRYQKPAEVVQALTPFVKAAKAVPGGEKKVQPGPGDKPTAPAEPVQDSLTFNVESKVVSPLRRQGCKATPAAARWWLVGSAVTVAVLLLGLIGLWAGGVLFKVKTADGLLVVQVNEPNAAVYVDGDQVSVTWDKSGKKAIIRVKPGTRQVEVKKDGFTTYGEEVTLEEGKRKVLTARLEKGLTLVPAKEKPAAVSEEGFVSLFNGKDLTGWKQHPVGSARWEVKDGVLIGSGGRGHLFHVANTYENFHLRVEASINAGGSGGPYFRQPFGPVRPQGWPSEGYSVRLDSMDTVSEKTGTLYINNVLTVNVVDSLIKADRLFTLDILADGPRIIAKVNGATTVDYVNPGPQPRAGQIALGVNDADSVIKYHKVQIKELPPGDRPLRWVGTRGYYDQVKGNVWLQHLDGRCKYLRETGRGDSIGLFEPFVGPTWVTLRRDSCHGAIGDGGWAMWCTGGWQVRERVAPVKKDPHARLGTWVPLFNGKDFDGWDVSSRDEANWTFEDGVLLGRVKGPLPSLLVTRRADYDHFHLRLETKVGKGQMGWALLRCGPPDNAPGGYQSYVVDIGGTDTVQTATGSLALGARGAPESLLCAAPALPPQPDRWLKVEIIAEGKRLRVLVDGKTAADYTDANETFTVGRLGLCCREGSEIRFRNVEIKELPPPASPAPLPDVAADGKGFVPLFNGKNLAGWNVSPASAANWELKDGILASRGGPWSYLVSERDDYRDFHLRLEAKINKPGTSGIFFWCVPGVPAPTGYKIQIGGSLANRWGLPTGSLYDFNLRDRYYDTAAGKLMSANEWFSLEIIAQGNRVRTLVNGKEAMTVALWVKHRAGSPIALEHLDSKTAIEFRKIEIKELTATR